MYEFLAVIQGSDRTRKYIMNCMTSYMVLVWLLRSGDPRFYSFIQATCSWIESVPWIDERTTVELNSLVTSTVAEFSSPYRKLLEPIYCILIRGLLSNFFLICKRQSLSQARFSCLWKKPIKNTQERHDKLVGCLLNFLSSELVRPKSRFLVSVGKWPKG